MKKPASLRQALTAALSDLARNPENLLVFVDKGSVIATYVPGLSFEYSYTLNVILTDYAGDPDTVMVPLLLWVRDNQPELLDNVGMRPDGITFEADIISHDACDLSLTLKLTERVIVAESDNGRLDITHIDEPMPEPLLMAKHWRLFLRDALIAEWDQPA
ncbi:phage tail protein [Dyella sp.]|uniref:phage tail protein n=1 Tax=Dyella sp. TaxID=1869338 RepID=UPI002B49AB56|nr:phage tail protein [Dyella sp.]